MAISPISLTTVSPGLYTQTPTITPRDPGVPQKANDSRLVPLDAQAKAVAEEINKEFGIKIRNTREKMFNSSELHTILNQLRRLPAEHVALIEEIEKNGGLGLQMDLLDAKQQKREVLGAYDKNKRRIYIFKDLSEPDLRSTITHEIGHAVHSHAVSKETFFNFMNSVHWKIIQQEQTYIPGNQLYTLGYSEREITPNQWKELMNHFDWEDLKKKKSKIGGYILQPPKLYQETYAFSNPFETFAHIYEKMYT